MNILVIAPHPDDDVIGCGGTLSHLAASGQQITILYLTSGDAGDATVEKKILSDIRESEAEKACAILGISSYEFLHFPDGNIQENEETLTIITEKIRQYQPGVLFIPHENDGHRDHRISYTLTMEAVWRAAANSHQHTTGAMWKVPTILAYEVWTPMTTISYTEDISDVIEKKTHAINAHSSQLKNVRYDRAMIGLHEYRAATTRTGQYAECFYAVRIGKIW
jgi:LmbE family N-acetylglucosaminyl deacetylase